MQKNVPTACTSASCSPGSSPTEGFPANELKAKAATRWILAKPETVAEAIFEAGPGGKAERYVPRAYWLAAAARLVAPAARSARDGRWCVHDRDRVRPDRDGVRHRSLSYTTVTKRFRSSLK